MDAVWDNVRSGATHFQQRKLPPPGHPIRQFFHGLSLPFHLHQALWSQPEARRRYLKVGVVQSLVILALAFTFTTSTNEAVDAARERIERKEQRAAKKEKQKNLKLLIGHHKFEIGDDDGKSSSESEDEQKPEADEKTAPSEAHTEWEEAHREAVAAAQREVQAALEKAERATTEAQVQEEVREAREAAREAREAARKERDEAREAREQADTADHEASEDAAEKDTEAESSLSQRLGIPNLEFWAALFAAVQVAQWLVIALSRDFHDSVSRDASLLTGLEPEDPPTRPRIRLDTKWLRNKFTRRIRAFMVFALGLPLLYAVSWPMPFGNKVASVLISAWSAYWLVVFTTSKTAHAWRDSEARPPWFLRAWTWLTTRVPGFRWGFLQGWGRFWANRTRTVFPPAAEMEKQPWAFAGLAVTRTLSMIPLVKCFLRPLIPVAAAHLIVARRIAEGDSKAEASAAPAPPPASAPEL